MSKHTEGPWEWANGTHALVGPKIDDKPVWLRPVVLRSETGVKAEDARLIAAAPALLEALQAWLALDRNFAAASDQHIAELIAEGAASAPIAKAVQMSRAAIAAATAQAGEVSHG